MNNTERLINVFTQALAISVDIINDDLQYNSIKEWDSTAHMALVAKIESEFDIMMDIDDIIDMSSVGKSKEILSKYGIEL